MTVIRTILAALVCVVALAAPSSAQVACGPKNPMACRDTVDLQRLLGRAEVRSAIRALVGDEPIQAVQDQPSAPAFDVVVQALAGPPDKPVKLSSGDVMLTDFTPHAAHFRGALVLRPDGSVAAVGLLIMRSVYANVPRTRDRKSTLTLFTTAKTDPRDVDAVTAWARDLAANQYVSDGEQRAPFAVDRRMR